MRGEFSTKDSVSSYHPSYDADFYDLRPKAKKTEGAERPTFQRVVRQDTKESLKKEALECLRHVSEYRILQTGFVRVGKYLCLGAVLPPYFLLVRLPILLLRAGYQSWQYVWSQVKEQGKNWSRFAVKMRQIVQLPEVISHLLKSVIKAPNLAWGYLKQQGRIFWQQMVGKISWPKISLPSWFPSGKIAWHFSKKTRWPNWKSNFIPRFSLRLDLNWKQKWSILSEQVQVDWKQAFLQAQEYLQKMAWLGKQWMRKIAEKRLHFQRRDHSQSSAKKKTPKAIMALHKSLEKVHAWGGSILEGWRWLLLACLACVRYLFQVIVWVVWTLWSRLPHIHIQPPQRPLWLRYPKWNWPHWRPSWKGKSWNVSFLNWPWKERLFSVSPAILEGWKERQEIFNQARNHFLVYLKEGAHTMLLSFLMSCILIVWGLQAVDRACSKNGLRNLGFPFFNKH